MNKKAASFFLALAFLLPATARTDPPNLQTAPVPFQAIASQLPPVLLQVAPHDPKAALLGKEARLNIVDSQIRDIRLKDNVKVARVKFFDRYRASLRLGEDDKMVELEPRTFSDNWGFVHSRHQQTYKGLDVLGAEYVLDEKNDLVVYAIGKIADGLDIDTNPPNKITEDQALAAALTDIGAEVNAWDIEPENFSKPIGLLAIGSKDSRMTKGSFRLVYRFVLSLVNPFGSYTVDVDAVTGEVVSKISNISESDVPSQGDTQYDGPQNFIADQFSDGGQTKYRLSMSGPPNVTTSFFQVDQSPKNLAMATLTGGKSKIKDIVDDQDDQDDNNFKNNKDGASVQWGVKKVLEYYALFGWLGWDGKGKNTIQSMIHKKSSEEIVDTAFYFAGKMYFSAIGDAGTGSNVALDIIGHEFTHGVVDQTSKFIYSAQSGSLNESFADIFGTLIEFSVKGQKGNWTIGEDEMLLKGPDSYLRNLANPKMKEDPDTYFGKFYLPRSNSCDETNDFCEVHQNSTVSSHWFYLLVNGGKGTNNDIVINKGYAIDGIGMEKAADIAFLTMTTLPPTATFKDARLRSLAVVEGLWGIDSPEYIAVMDSWHAVGVGPSHAGTKFFDPPDGKTGVMPWPAQLGWEVNPGESLWEVQVAESPDFDNAAPPHQTSSVSIKGGKTMTSSDEFELEPDTTYYWRTRAVKWFDSGSAAFSPQIIRNSEPQTVPGNDWGDAFVHVFVTDSRKAALKSPGFSYQPNWLSFGAIDDRLPVAPEQMNVHPWPTEFLWKPVEGATKYSFSVSETPDFSGATVHYVDPLNPDNMNGSLIRGTLNLKVNKDYYWKVQAHRKTVEMSSGRPSPNEQGASFSTSFPEAELIAPPDNESVSPWGIQLSWKTVDGASGYDVVVSKNKDLSNPEDIGPPHVETNSKIVNIKPYDGGPNPVYYYWSVLPKGPAPDNEPGKQSSPRKFNVDYEKTRPVLVSPQPGAVIPYETATVPFTWKQVLSGGLPGGVYYNLSFYQNPTIIDGAPFLGTATPVKQIVVNPSVANSQDAESNVTTLAAPNVGSGKNVYCWNVQAFGPNNFAGTPSKGFCYTIVQPKPPEQSAVVPCSAKQVAGGSTKDTRVIELGKTNGSFTMTYTTYEIEDKIDVQYVYNGQSKIWSSGCVGTGMVDPSNDNSPGIYVTSDPIQFNGSSQATVIVTPWCKPVPGDTPSTEWGYTLNCP